ncbi:fatty acid synthase S-acetyltransferase [Colletotrichum navitas]|uniref:Fatty acid synthase S-acetyltransferase n=1 Tax=Colletotrichum navitas TaxID=681940 RepID=A0AAD8V0T1_9PEZI|nr:fatty acid synthase S-acetyltransferase [Colletotrichum navitas]KAK1580580.1 fatty acid synthase S-acetyltransferase [Colletotrichum navitas]
MGRNFVADGRSMAIIGLSCRFPGDANSPTAFWELLCKGQSAYSTVPKDRFNISAFHSGPREGLNKSRTEGGHFLSDDIRRWDANFFGITADEASAMDPQQRLMMEVAYEAFENAGVTPAQLDGSDTGVWMGVNSNDWRETLFRDPEAAPLHTWTGTGPEYISGRVSWFFNLRGPSMTVNTACSSSLVALHEARNAILAGDCKMAIVGGANLIFNPEYFLYYSNQMFLSPDGKCKSFDAAGDGFGRGEGLGAVVLKPLADAVRDGDAIRAVLKGSGVGQDGWTTGITLPNAEAQADLIRRVYAEAGLPTSQTGFVEAHGTGTKVGDPAELEAISKALGTTTGKQHLLVGSVKTNIGHLEAAAGIAGLIKAVLMLEKAQIPPTIGIKHLNPRIKWDEWKMTVPEELIPWPSIQGPRRIGLSSFGASGTITHAIVEDGEEYSRPQDGVCDKQSRSHTPAGLQLIVLSAGDKEGIMRQATSVAKYLRESRAATRTSHKEGAEYLRRLAFTLGARRAHLAHRCYTVVPDIKELCNRLAPRQPREDAGTPPQLVTRRAAVSDAADSKLRIGMIFTGQGAQWARMGLELLKYDTFRHSIERADVFLRQSLGCKWSVHNELGASAEHSNMNKAEYSQPLCTVLQVALVDLLASWNITPAAVTGHSSGEIGAAYALGVLSEEDAWTAAYWRGNLDSRSKQPKGAMLAAGMSQDDARALVARVPRSDGVVVVGCVNSPSSVTLSGDEKAIETAGRLLTEAGIFNRKLKVDAAYHSPHQARVSDEYFMRIRHIKPRPAKPGRIMFSSVTGKAVASHLDLGPANWVRNLVSPVLFAQSVEAMLRSEEAGIDVLLEVGPHAALAAPCQGTMSSCGVTLDYLSVLTRGEDAVATSLAAAGDLWARGAGVDVSSVNSPEQPGAPDTRPQLLTDLPPYQWNHARSYWTESRLGSEYRNRQHPHYRFLGAPLPTLVAGEYMWRALIRPDEEHWLRDHKIQGTVVYPAVGYIAMAVEAARQLATKDGQDGVRKVRAFRLREVEFLAATQPGEHEPIEMTICARHATQDRPDAAAGATQGWYHFTISTCTDGQAVRKTCAGFITIEREPSPESFEAYELAKMNCDIKNRFLEAQEACRQSKKPETLYEELARIGLEFGPAFRNMSSIWMGESQSYCTVDVVNPSSERDGWSGSEGEEAERPFIIHPATFDPITQTIAPAMGFLSRTPVPTAIDELLISVDIPYKVGERLHVFSSVVPRANHDLLSDIYALDESLDRPVLSLRGFKAAQLAPRDCSSSLEDAHNMCGRIEWRPALDVLIRSPDHLKEYLLHAAAGSASMTERVQREFINLIFHNLPESSILEVGPEASGSGDVGFSSTILQGLQEDISAPWHHILDHTLAVWRDTFQVISPEKETQPPPSLDDVQFDVVFVQWCMPTDQADAVVREAVQKTKQSHSLGLTCFRGPSGELEAAMSKIGFKPFLSMKDPESDDSFVVIRALPETDCKDGINARKSSNEQDSQNTIIIQAAEPSELEEAVAIGLSKELQQRDVNFTAIKWDELDREPGLLNKAHIICLVEVSTTMIADLDERAFATFKSLVTEANKILWVTYQGRVNDGDMQIGAAVNGLARSLKNEDARVKFRVAHFDHLSSPQSEAMAGMIRRLAFSDTRDEEFNIRKLNDDDDGLLVAYCSRVIHDMELSNYVEEKQRSHIDFVRLDSVGKPSATVASQNNTGASSSKSVIKLDIAERGQLDTLHFVQHDGELALDLPEDEVEVRVHASGLNFKDIMIAMGRVVGTMEGAEGSGVIERVGKSVTTLNVQDRVVCLAIGMHASVVRIKAAACRRIPDTMSFVEAASLPVVHCTAYNAFVRIARLETDEIQDIRKTVLIHAAAGGLGQVAIQYAQHFNMEIFVTVGSDIKRELVKKLYGIPEDHILCSRDTSFAMAVKRMTNQRGVDLVLNSLSGEMLRETWQCLAPGGTFIEVGKAVLDSLRPPAGNEIGATYTVFDLEHIVRGDSRLTGRLLDGALDYVRRGITKPVSPCRQLPISDVHEAFRLMQTGRHTGKLLFSWTGDFTVPVRRPNILSVVASSPASRLRSDATYVLVGGLGGIGRSLARMLVEMGARNLCFISRSGLRPKPASALAAELEAIGVKVKAYECDAAEAAQAEEALSRCRAEMPPIRGVLQCAMVLRDCTFANMDFTQWTEAVRPKIQASWNIHSLLATSKIDFFVMLASFAGYFGNAGQSNYGAGCAFQDALANHRRSNGLPAVSLDLGIINDVGVLAETGMTDNLRDWAPSFGISERKLQNLVRVAIQDQLAGTGVVAAQIPTGFASLRAANAAGIPRPSYLDDPRFAILASEGRLAAPCSTEGGQKQQAAPSFRQRLDAAKAAKSAAEVRAVVSEMLTQKVAQCLKVTEDEVDQGKSLPSYGINSLVAIEIRNWFFREINAEVTIFNLIAPVSLSKLVENIANGLLPEN